MGITSIEWTNRSINPFRARDKEGHTGHYCEKISQGCANCYASRMQKRFRMSEYKVNSGIDGNVFLDESKLQEVLRRKTPTKWFWCDMTDMFLGLYPDDWIDKCFAVMALTPQHTHQILTKRPERMREYLNNLSCERIRRAFAPMIDYGIIFKASLILALNEGGPRFRTLPNVWLGVSVEDQKTADERIPILLDTPAAVRWISAEPILGPIKLDNAPGWDYLRGQKLIRTGISEKHLDWVVIGGESGPRARECNLDWIDRIVRQCRAADVPCFVKQLGKNSFTMIRGIKHATEISDGKGKHIEEFPNDIAVREFPEVQL